MKHEVNPFQELYVTDTPDLPSFVQLFSDYPARHAHALFRPGNVVLKGTQGSGKSMLLNLLRPEIQVAYHQAGVDFPVPSELCRFVGAGINLDKSGALNMGARWIGDDPVRDEAMFPMYFADFLNFFVVGDILKSLMTLQKEPGAFGGLVTEAYLDTFARRLAGQDCWFNALSGVRTFAQLRNVLDGRISAYREFHNNYEIPWPIKTTPTTIGEPIARTAQCLKEEGVIADTTPVFVRIDQLERLYRSDLIRPSLGREYKRIINKALGTRDLRVSYRVGTRRYGWDDDLHIFGTGEQLEHLRDYRIIDLDYVLQRQENPQTWFFPRFIEDVFARRLVHAGCIAKDDPYWRKPPRKRNLLRKVFGRTKAPGDAARQYALRSTPQKAARINHTWPAEWRSFLADLFDEDPLEAVLAAAWARQRGTSAYGADRLQRPPPAEDRPWNKTYWRKERIRQGLTQIAARAAQRLQWSGKESLLALSAGNITVFVSICHEVWESFLRSQRSVDQGPEHNPLDEGIPASVQAVGIDMASEYWYMKIAELPRGDDRQGFLDAVARTFRSWLIDDLSMSYPGHNGFSLALDDIRGCPALWCFLREAAAYGDLYDRPHTTKRKDRRQRRKWYLNPILSPHYQLPESHAKEPYYATINDVVWWVHEAQLVIEGIEQIAPEKPMRGRDKRREHKTTEVPSLFDPGGETKR